MKMTFEPVGMLPVETSVIDAYRLGAGFTGAVERGDVSPRDEEALRRAEQVINALSSQESSGR